MLKTKTPFYFSERGLYNLNGGRFQRGFRHFVDLFHHAAITTKNAKMNALKHIS